MTQPTERTLDDLMAATPVHNQAVRCARRAKNELLLTIPLRQRWFTGPPFSWILPLGSQRKVALDRLGAEVWDACTGENNTQEIIEGFAQRHQLTFHEARVSICTYLQQLTQRKLIVLVGHPTQEIVQ